MAKECILSGLIGESVGVHTSDTQLRKESKACRRSRGKNSAEQTEKEGSGWRRDGWQEMGNTWKNPGSEKKQAREQSGLLRYRTVGFFGLLIVFFWRISVLRVFRSRSWTA